MEMSVWHFRHWLHRKSFVGRNRDFYFLTPCNSFFSSKVNIWYVNCARATAFIFDTRTGVLVKVSKFLREKMSRPEGDSNPQSSDSFVGNRNFHFAHSCNSFVSRVHKTDIIKILRKFVSCFRYNGKYNLCTDVFKHLPSCCTCMCLTFCQPSDLGTSQMARRDIDPSEFIGDRFFIFRQKEPGENNIK